MPRPMSQAKPPAAPVWPAELPPTPPPVQCPVNCVNGCVINNVCACPADCPDACNSNGLCKAGGGGDCETNPDDCQPQDDGGLVILPIPPLRRSF